MSVTKVDFRTFSSPQKKGSILQLSPLTPNPSTWQSPICFLSQVFPDEHLIWVESYYM